MLQFKETDIITHNTFFVVQDFRRRRVRNFIVEMKVKVEGISYFKAITL
jgi:hypothetical protein